MRPDDGEAILANSRSMKGAARKAALDRIQADLIAVVSSFEAFKAEFDEQEGASAAAASHQKPSRAGRKLWPPRPEEIDLNDGTWLRGFKEAAHIARMSEAHLYRHRHIIAIKIRKRWWVKIDRLNDPTI